VKRQRRTKHKIKQARRGSKPLKQRRRKKLQRRRLLRMRPRNVTARRKQLRRTPILTSGKSQTVRIGSRLSLTLTER